MPLFDILRTANVALCAVIAVLSGIAYVKGWFPPGRWYLRFLRLGQIVVYLATGLGTLMAILDHRPPSLTAPILFAGLVLSGIGAVGTILVEAKRQPAKQP